MWIWSRPVVPKLCSADSKVSATISPRIRGYIAVMVTLNFTYFLNYVNNVQLKIIAGIL